MRTKNIEQIGLLLLVTFLFLNLIPGVHAISIGISPSEKSIEMTVGEQTDVYFAVSQGSKETESVTMSTDASWLQIDTASFDLQSMEQKYVKFTIVNLPVGNYTAKIKASTSQPGVASMAFSSTARLSVSVLPTGAGGEEKLKQDATDSITNAQNMINTAKKAGVDTSESEGMLTSALDEFAKGDYAVAKALGESAYNLAAKEYSNVGQGKTFLEPLKIGLIVIVGGLSVIVVVLLYEVFKLRGSREKIEKVTGVKCPECGKGMYLAYDGNMFSSYVCPKCGHKEVKEKTVF